MTRKVLTCVLNMPFNEGHGDPHDSSGFGNDGTNNGADWVSGDRGWALDFVSANTDYVSCGNADSLDITDELTIMMWANIDAHKNYNPLISKRLAGDCNYQLSFDATGYLAFYDGSGYTDTQQYVSTCVWHHLGMTYTGTTAQLYVDGVAVDSFNVGALPSNAQDVLIGTDNSGNCMNGSMNDIVICNHAWTTAEILAYFNATQTKYQSCVLNMPFNEGHGDPHDSSGYGNNGTNNGADWVSGDRGWSLDFNGSTDYVECGSDPSMNLDDNFTIEAWIKAPSQAAAQVVMWGEEVVGKRRSLFIYNSYMLFSGYGGTSNLDSGIIVANDIWHHCVVTIDSSDYARTYVDGVVGAHGSVVLNDYSYTGLNIGQNKSGAEKFTGSICGCNVYNRVLSAAEIRAYYNAAQTKYQPCVLNMPMNEGQGDPHDSSGYGNDGTNNGADWTSGDYGWALEFNGSSDYVNVPSDSSFNPGSAPTTMISWVRPADITIANEMIVSYGGGYELRLTLSKAALFWQVGNPILGTSDMVNGTWYHVAGAYDGTNGRIYVNGIEENSVATTPALSFAGVDIGRRLGGGFLFEGDISGVRIYKRDWSTSELLADFNATKARYGL